MFLWFMCLKTNLKTIGLYTKIPIIWVYRLTKNISENDLDEIQASEEAHIKTALKEISELEQSQSDALAALALKEIEQLAGKENHRYCYELNEVLGDQAENEKYQILLMLFAVAASDGVVESVESEEIRNITKALLLEHKHYISARATVAEKLKALQS